MRFEEGRNDTENGNSVGLKTRKDDESKKVKPNVPNARPKRNTRAPSKLNDFV